MYNNIPMTFRIDQLVFMASAIEEQIARYSERWRKTMIEHGEDIARVYLPSIETNQLTLKEIRAALHADKYALRRS